MAYERETLFFSMLGLALGALVIGLWLSLVFDRQGRMLAQAVTGTPGHINALASCVVHFLDAHPIDTMEPGDVFITNDPWLASGHQHDITVATPVFVNGRPVAVVANTCHVVDIGGRGFTPDGRQVYEEGLNIPILHLFRRGEVNDTLMAIVRMNVRESTQVVGDLYSFTAANDIAAQRLVAMMAEFAIDDLGPLADFIVTSSREATIERIRALPRSARDLLDALSPDRRIGSLRAPLFLIHGRQDPAVPFTESLRLDAAARAAGRPVRTAIVGAVGHVEADARAGVADLLRLWATFYAFRRTAGG